MRILTTLLTLCVLASGCATSQPAPAISAKGALKAKEGSESLDLAKVQNQLAIFVEVVELLNQGKSDSSSQDHAEIPAKKLSSTTESATPELEGIITAINDNLEQLNNAQDEAKTVRQMLNIADQFSDNDRNLFTGLFDLIIKGTSSTK